MKKPCPEMKPAKHMRTLEPKPEMTVREAGRLGGKKVSEKYGPDFYKDIGHRGGSTTNEKYGPEFYGAIGKKGGQATAEKHGTGFYEKIGKKGGQRVKELIERAKAAESGE